MAGTLTISTLSDGTNSTSSTNCIQGSAKAWAYVTALSTTPAVTAGYNVSSVTKNATGNYTVNFTAALTDANYAPIGFTQSASGGTTLYTVGSFTGDTKTSSACQIRIGVTSTLADGQFLSCAFFR